MTDITIAVPPPINVDVAVTGGPGPKGDPGADSTVPGPPGADSTVPGPPGPPGPGTLVIPYRTNAWYGQPINGTGTYLPNDGVVGVNLVPIPANYAITSMIFEVTVAGSAGAVARLGVYRLNTANTGGVLETDLGTVDVTTAGQIEVPCPVPAKDAPWLAVLVLCAQGNAATRATYRSTGLQSQFYPLARTTTAGVVAMGNPQGYTVAGVQGPLPASFAMLNEGSTAPRLLIRGIQS